MVKNIFSSSRTVLIVESILVILALILVMWIGYQREMDSQENLIKQEAGLLITEIEDFLQTGQIYVSSYASNLELGGNFDSVILQLKKFLLPFPFFNQINVTDSDGNIVAGFPQNNVGQRQVGFTISKSDLLDDVLIIPRKNNSSLTLFIKQIGNPNSSVLFFLVGESDFRANPTSLGLQRVISSLSSKVVNVNLMDEAGSKILDLFNAESLIQNIDSISNYYQKDLFNNWSVRFAYLNKLKFIEVLVSSIPLIFILIILQVIFIISYMTANRPKNIQPEELKISDKKYIPDRGRKESFISHLAEVSSLEKVAQLFLNYTEIKDESSIRLVLFENPLEKNNKRLLSFAKGKNSNDFSYLDEQIAILLDKYPLLEIPEIIGSREIHLRQDRKYPRAIFAAPILSEKTMYGFIWHGFDKPEQFDAEEKKYIQEIIESGKRLLITLHKNQIFKDISVTQNLILESIPMPVMLLGEKNVVLYSNQQAIKSFEFKEEPAGKDIQDLFNHHMTVELANCKTNGIYIYEKENGEIYKVHIDCVQEFHEQTKKLLVFENISTQEKWKKNYSETTTLLAHDLRVPLTVIKGYLTMLPVMGQLNQQQRSYIEKGIRQVDEMNDQIKHLFTIERLNEGDGLIKDDIEIHKLIDEIVSSQMPIAEQKRIELACEFSSSSEIHISGDRTLIKMAVNRIIENAIRFTANEGKISIRTGLVQNMSEIAIEDNGCGISAVDLPHIFEKSYRMKINTTFETSEKGQSLSLVKSIIEKHGGEIGAVSELGKGSTFFIRLPLKISEK